ncbi:MAG: hypothetical protein VW258_16005, partial [Thalassolituus sp.]
MSRKKTAGGLYKRLSSYVWPQKWYFLLSVVGFALFAASAPALAHLMGMVEKNLNYATEDNILLLIRLFMG